MSFTRLSQACSHHRKCSVFHKWFPFRISMYMYRSKSRSEYNHSAQRIASCSIHCCVGLAEVFQTCATPRAHSRIAALNSAGFSRNAAWPAPSMNFVVRMDGSHFVYMRIIAPSVRLLRFTVRSAYLDVINEGYAVHAVFFAEKDQLGNVLGSITHVDAPVLLALPDPLSGGSLRLGEHSAKAESPLP